MKKNLVCVLILIFSILSCFKDKEKSLEQDLIIENSVNVTGKVDLGNFRQIVDNSKKLTPEVFIAITALHHSYIEELEQNANSTENENYEAIFEKQRIDFFKTIPYPYIEYMEFFENQKDEMTEYILEHPELLQYLTIMK